MHIKDYCFIVFVLGLSIGLAGFWALSRKQKWWLDAMQVAGLMIGFAMIVGVVTPAKPKSDRKIAKEIEAATENASNKAIINAMTACDYAIQAQLTYPESYSRNPFSNSNRQFETARGWEIYKAFEAKNGFGGSLPHVGHCTVLRNGSITVEISKS